MPHNCGADPHADAEARCQVLRNFAIFDAQRHLRDPGIAVGKCTPAVLMIERGHAA